MKRFTKSIVLAVMVCIFLITPSFAAQDWPKRPIDVLVTFSPGGAVDIAVRIIAEYATKNGMRMNVVNSPTGSGTSAALKIKGGRTDGYNLIVTSNSCMFTLPQLKNVGYTLDDFQPIANINNFVLTFVTRTSDGFTSLDDWLNKAAANPGKFTYGSPTPVSAQRLMMTYLIHNKFPHIKIVHVPYDGGHAVNTALLAGQITAAIGVPGTNKSYINSGDFTLLAVSGMKRLKEWPDVPTIAELYGQEYSFTAFNGFLAKKGTPPEIVDKISNMIEKALQDPDVVQKLERMGLTPDFQNSEEFTANIKQLNKVSQKALSLIR